MIYYEKHYIYLWWHIRYRYWLSRRTRLLERRQRTDNHQRRLQRIQFQSFPQFWWNKLFLGFFYENVNKRSQSISYNRHRIAGRHRYRLGIKEHVLDRLDERYRRSGQFGFQRSARPFQHKRKISFFVLIWIFLIPSNIGRWSIRAASPSIRLAAFCFGATGTGPARRSREQMPTARTVAVILSRRPSNCPILSPSISNVTKSAGPTQVCMYHVLFFSSPLQ